MRSKSYAPPPFFESNLGKTIALTAAASAPLAAAGLIAVGALSAKGTQGSERAAQSSAQSAQVSADATLAMAQHSGAVPIGSGASPGGGVPRSRKRR